MQQAIPKVMVFIGAINNPQMSLTTSICRAAGLVLASP